LAIQRVRQSCGDSQEQAAREIGVSPRTVWRREYGQHARHRLQCEALMQYINKLG